MRVREIMSSPVVTVVEDGELVGLLSEADLVPLELDPDPRAHLAPLPSILIVLGRRVVGIVARRDLLEVLARSGKEIVRDLEVLLAAELGPSQPYRVIVRDGVVDLTGPADPVDRRLATLLARGVPGVLKVHLDTELWP